MSERRRARGIAPSRGESGVPTELTDPLNPIWHDEAALLARFPDLVDDRILGRLRMGGRVYQQVLSKWAMANGYASEEYPQHPDWRRLRATWSQ